MKTCTTTNHISVDGGDNCMCGHFVKAANVSDRRTLETLASILSSSDDPKRCTEIAQSYIRNKLEMYSTIKRAAP